MGGQSRLSDTIREAEGVPAGAGSPTDSPERDDLQLLLLGQHIRNHRLQQRQPYVDRPWSQADLAVAIGSDTAHINPPECGRPRPPPKPLDRISDTLALPIPAPPPPHGRPGF